MINNSNLTKEEELQDMGLHTDPGTKNFELSKMKIVVKCTQDIENSIGFLQEAIDAFSKNSSQLGKKVFYLNIVLAAATAVYAIVSCIQLFIR